MDCLFDGYPSYPTSVREFRGSRFKGCKLITIRNFVNVLFGKTERFHTPKNLEHGTWPWCGKTRFFQKGFRGSNFSFFPNPELLNPEPVNPYRDPLSKAARNIV